MTFTLPKRTNPRRRTILRLEAGRHDRERVLNLSANGMFVAGASVADAQNGALFIPGEDRPLELKFRHVFRRADGIGVQFEASDRRTRNDLLAYVTHQHEQARLQAIEARLHGQAVNLKPLDEQEGTRVALRPLERSGRAVEVYRKLDGPPVRAALTSVDTSNARLSLLLDGGAASPEEFDQVFLVMRQGDVAFLADTVVETSRGPLTSLMLPERIFFPERRMLEREESGTTLLRVDLDGQTRIAGVLQHDPNGLSILVWTADAAAFARGRTLEGAMLQEGDRQVPLGPVEVVWRADAPTEGRLRMGLRRVQARVAVDQQRLAFAVAPPTLLGRARGGVRHVVGGWLAQTGVLSTSGLPAVWEIPDAEGRPIVALANATFDPAHPPEGAVHVVLLPPPFARRKETHAPVALSLVETFRAAGLHALVVRWDGINHLGESWKDAASSQPGRELLHWTLGQTVRDLAAVHAHVRARLGDRPTPTAIVSFSMSAVAARRYLATGATGVDYWMAPMGAPDPRDIIRNSSGGVDWVGMRKQGKTHGVNLIQGHLLDCDQGCDEMLRGRLAELEDARREMALIHQPVTWLCGEHDYWVNPLRVRDILGVPAPGERELLSVPTGHFVRQSGEAMETFRLITGRVATRLAGKEVRPRLPASHVYTRGADWERARRKLEPFDDQAYWSSYLRGTQRNPLGFDVLALTDEYEELMTEQVEQLALRPGERVLDAGCGTGNALAAIVRRWGRDAQALDIDAVDFVPHALDTARAKAADAAIEVGLPPQLIRFHVADLRLPSDMPVLPFGDSAFDVVLVSLVLPYLSDPAPLLRELRRVLRPGGRLVASTLRPDCDMSGPLKRLKEKIDTGDSQIKEGWKARQLLAAVQDDVNAAAGLVEQEADGRFRFYEREDFEALLRDAGLRVETTIPTFGAPPQGMVTVGRNRDG
jgi:SAM-dependent methyltransferase